MNDLNIIPFFQTHGSVWREFQRIYHQSFPDWERESDDIILKRIEKQDYLLFVGQLDSKVIGFYLLEANPEYDFVMFNFLAVDEAYRGKGLGTLLCKDAMQRFKRLQLCNCSLLVIEAEDRQAIFYGELGFLKLVLDYQVPCFDSSQSMPMHLMVLPARQNLRSISSKKVYDIIYQIFVHGYLLSKDDPRLTEQLTKIAEDIDLITWSKENRLKNA